MQMALTCSHKILKAHSYEAPDHNAAVAMRYVGRDSPPVWESETQILLVIAQVIVVVW